MWPSPPAPITTAGPARGTRDRLLDVVDPGQPGVGQRRDVRGLEQRIDLTPNAAGQQEVGEPAVAVDAGEGPLTQCMSSPRRQAPHSPQEMKGWTMTVSPTSTFGDRGADLVDPARVLVPGRVGQDDPDFSAHCPSWM